MSLQLEPLEYAPDVAGAGVEATAVVGAGVASVAEVGAAA